MFSEAGMLEAERLDIGQCSGTKIQAEFASYLMSLAISRTVVSMTSGFERRARQRQLLFIKGSICSINRIVSLVDGRNVCTSLRDYTALHSGNPIVSGLRVNIVQLRATVIS